MPGVRGPEALPSSATRFFRARRAHRWLYATPGSSGTTRSPRLHAGGPNGFQWWTCLVCGALKPSRAAPRDSFEHVGPTVGYMPPLAAPTQHAGPRLPAGGPNGFKWWTSVVCGALKPSRAAPRNFFEHVGPTVGYMPPLAASAQHVGARLHAWGSNEARWWTCVV